MDRSILNDRVRGQEPGRRWAPQATLMLTVLVLAGLAGCLDDGEPIASGDTDSSLEPLDKELTLYANADGRTSNPYPYLNPAPRGGLAAIVGATGPGEDAFVWSFPMDPPLDSSLVLAAGSSVQAVIHLEGRLGPTISDGDGNFFAPGAGIVTLFPRITSGGETVAEGHPRDVVVMHAEWRGPDEPYPKESWDMGLQTETIERGADLVWEVHVVEAVPSLLLLLGTGEARGHSHIVLPVLESFEEPKEDEA